eukprot:g1009.t1
MATKSSGGDTAVPTFDAEPERSEYRAYHQILKDALQSGDLKKTFFLRQCKEDRGEGVSKSFQATVEHIAIGAIINKRYKLLAVLSFGCFGQGWKAQDTSDGTIVFLKTFKFMRLMDKKYTEGWKLVIKSLAKEIRNARTGIRTGTYRHKNIVDYYDAQFYGTCVLRDGTEVATKFPFLVTEFVEGSELQDYCSKYFTALWYRASYPSKTWPNVKTHEPSKPQYLDDVKNIRSFFVQLMRGVAHLHSRNTYVWDIKADNLMVTSKGHVLKIMDFGMGDMLIYGPVDIYLSGQLLLGMTCVKEHLPYMMRKHKWDLPALHHSAGAHENITSLDDLMAISPKVKDRFYDKKYVKPSSVRARPDLTYPDGPALLDLLEKMLHKNPASRITADEVLKHPWCTGSRYLMCCVTRFLFACDDGGGAVAAPPTLPKSDDGDDTATSSADPKIEDRHCQVFASGNPIKIYPCESDRPVDKMQQDSSFDKCPSTKEELQEYVKILFSQDMTSSRVSFLVRRVKAGGPANAEVSPVYEKWVSRQIYDNSDKSRYIVINRRYQLLRVLGAGCFGQGWVARDLANGGRQVFVKTFQLRSLQGKQRSQVMKSIKYIRKELQNARTGIKTKKFSHVNCVAYIDAQFSGSARTREGEADLIFPFLVTELVDGVELQVLLQEYLSTLWHRKKKPHTARPGAYLERTENVRHIFVQLIRGIAHLHTNNVFVWDIKPDNLMVTSEAAGRILKIMDFGCGKITDGRARSESGAISTSLSQRPQAHSAPELKPARFGGIHTGDEKVPGPVDVYLAGQVLLGITCLGEHFDFMERRKWWELPMLRVGHKSLEDLKTLDDLFKENASIRNRFYDVAMMGSIAMVMVLFFGVLLTINGVEAIPTRLGASARFLKMKEGVCVKQDVLLSTSQKENTEAVTELQQMLVDLKCNIGSAGVDGDFGGGTKDGVMEFQAMNDLDVDGVVGPNTWSKLCADSGKVSCHEETHLHEAKTWCGWIELPMPGSVVDRGSDYSRAEIHEVMKIKTSPEDEHETTELCDAWFYLNKGMYDDGQRLHKATGKDPQRVHVVTCEPGPQTSDQSRCVSFQVPKGTLIDFKKDAYDAGSGKRLEIGKYLKVDKDHGHTMYVRTCDYKMHYGPMWAQNESSLCRFHYWHERGDANSKKDEKSTIAADLGIATLHRRCSREKENTSVLDSLVHIFLNYQVKRGAFSKALDCGARRVSFSAVPEEQRYYRSDDPTNKFCETPPSVSESNFRIALPLGVGPDQSRNILMDSSDISKWYVGMRVRCKVPARDNRVESAIVVKVSPKVPASTSGEGIVEVCPLGDEEKDSAMSGPPGL